MFPQVYAHFNIFYQHIVYVDWSDVCNHHFVSAMFVFRPICLLSLDSSCNILLEQRKCDKQQRSVHSRFNIHSSHKYIYSLRSQQSVSQCHNTSPSSSHYPWQHANIPVSESHLSQASTYRVSHKQVGKFMLSFDLLCFQSVYKSPCLPHSPRLLNILIFKVRSDPGIASPGRFAWA